MLIENGEDTRVEYKQTLDFTNLSVRPELALDILAMANAHDPSPGYILIGVEEGTPPNLHDAASLLLDDGTLHGFLEEYMEPPVDFSFNYVQYKGVTLGLFTVPPSSSRFHVVKKDYTKDSNQGGRFKLSKGDVWIRSGARRRKISGFDMQRLRNDLLRQNVPAQPKLEVTFDGGHCSLPLQAVWKQPMPHVRIALATARFMRGLAASGELGHLWMRNPENIQMPHATMALRFQIHNRGTFAADNMIVDIKIPNGCNSWAGATLFNPESQRSPGWRTNYGVRDKRIRVTGVHLVHGLDRRSDVVCITFPSPNQVYEFHWTAHAGNMLKPCEGVLRLEPSC